MSLKKLGSETLIYGMSNILGKVLNFLLVVPFLTDIMEEEFGVVGDLFFWTALLIALLVFRLDTAVFRFASRKENDAAAVFRKTQGFVAVATLTILGGLALAAGPVAVWLGYPGTEIYVYLVLATVAFDALSAVPLARLRLQQRPWRFVAANLGNVFVNLGLIFLLLYWWPAQQSLLGIRYTDEHQVAYYLITIAVAAAFRYAFLVVESLSAGQSKPRVSEAKVETPRQTPSLKSMLWYSLPLTIVAVAGIINALVGPTVLRQLYGADQLQNDLVAGQFNAALKLAVFLNLAITAYNYAAEPFFFREAGNDPAKADKTIYADALRAYGIVAALACAGILLFLPWLKFFIKDDVLREGLYVLPVLLAANVCFGIYSNLSVAYKLTDKTFLGGGIALLGSIVVIAINFIFITDLGLYAPAIGMLACYGLMSVLAYGVSRRYFPVDYPVGRLTIYAILSSAAVYGGGLLLDGSTVTELGAAAGAMAGRGALFLVLLAAIAAMEMGWIRRTFVD